MPRQHTIIGMMLAGALGCAQGQWLHYPDPRTPRTKDGKPNLAASTPRAADSKPDLSGVWIVDPTPPSEIHRVLGDDFTEIQIDLRTASKYTVNLLWDHKPEEELITPAAAALMKKRAQAPPSDDSSTRCLPAGIPFTMLILPFKAIQSARELVMIFEHQDPPRQIYLDGRPLPKDPEPSFMGYSSGKWQGDTLVVDTAGFKEEGGLDIFGHPRSTSTHIVERFQRRDFGHMDYEIRVEDPKWYTRPFSVKMVFNVQPDSDVLEYICGENEKDRVHLATQ
jgi:hypothetical protein